MTHLKNINVFVLFLFLVANLEISLAQIARTPLCSHCSCTTNQTLAVIDVDCSDRIVTYDVLYAKSNWQYDANTTYPIGKAIFKDSDLGDLRNKFQASGLTYLDFSFNFIKHIDDNYFYDLQEMKVLILSHNEIDKIKPDVFQGPRMDGRDYPLKSLTTLKLDSNRLHTLDQDLFKHVEETLEILDLTYNPFKVIDQQTVIAITSLTYLKELYLAHTQLKALPDNFLHTPKYLKVIDLSSNNFKAVPQTLNNSHVLEVINFGNNPIVNLTAENGFPTLTTVKVVHMCDMMELERIEKGSMSGLENIEELHICNNMKLTTIDPAALTRIEVETEIWPPLKKLNLQNNELTRMDLHLVLRWEYLIELDLRYNPWTCECENQWMVEELIPIYLKINETLAKELRCEAPIEMEGKTFYGEYTENKEMRCLDEFGNRPEKDATILIGVLVGLLIGIPLILFMIFAYQRHWFGLFDSSPASFSRQFYSRTRSEDL